MIALDLGVPTEQCVRVAMVTAYTGNHGDMVWMIPWIMFVKVTTITVPVCFFGCSVYV